MFDVHKIRIHVGATREPHKAGRIGCLPLLAPPVFMGWPHSPRTDVKGGAHLTPAASGTEAVAVALPTLASARFAFV